jgi:hypothetical protein
MHDRSDVQHDLPDHGERLSPADQRVLDALVQVGFEPGRLPEALNEVSVEDQRRAQTVVRLLRRLDDYPVEDAEPALLHATLARIDRHEDQLAARMRFDVQEEVAGARVAGAGRRIRVPDFISVAAVLLIVAGVMWPVLEGVRQRSVESACANNMRRLGYAFDQYSSHNAGALPMMAGPLGTWDTVKNILNLKPLIDQGYCDAGHLNCPGHRTVNQSSGEPSYSYRLFTPRGAIRWNTGHVTLILGDLNPLIDAARSGLVAPPLSISVNHGGRGQNVLATDGQTIWLTEPRISGDNIWLPDHLDLLQPGAAPSNDMDVFLVQ